MSLRKGIAARLRAVLRPSSAEQRMEEEFAFHVEMETRRLTEQGLPLPEARRRALASFGGVQRYRDEMREGRGAHWLHDLRGDLRYGARMLWKSKGLTAIAVASLAVGIGANSAIFSIVNAILLRPRAVARPDQLVHVYAGYREMPYSEAFSYPSYTDFRDRNEVLSGLAGYSVGRQFKLRGADDVELVWGEVVTGNFFDVLGVPALHGRMFAPDEDRVPSRNPVVVIGHGLWQRRFASDTSLIGKTITVNNQALTVIGIAPPSYTGMLSGWAAELWVPAMLVPLLYPPGGELMISSRGSRWLAMVGRLKPGATIEQARARFAVLTAALTAQYPDEWTEQREELAQGRTVSTRQTIVTVLPERDARVHPALRGPAYAVAALVFVVVNLVLVIACMNLAGMLFARGVARRSEIAVRLALGAARPRIIRQLLTESILLALLAGIAGALLAFWALSALVTLMPALPEGIRLSLDVDLDWRVVLYTVAFTGIIGVLFGLAPALHASRSAVSSVLKDDATTLAGAHRTSRARQTLIVAQVALSLLMLIGAGLMLRSLANVRPTRLGFTTENVVVAPLALEEATYNRQRAHRFYEDVSSAIAALPGVRSVSLVDGMPGGFMSRTRGSIGIEGYTPAAGESLEIDASIVGPRYFTNMNVPVVSGRDFDGRDRDGAPCVAIVNEAFARRYLGSTAIGKRLIRILGPQADQRKSCEIVGVIRDNAWQSLQREIRPFFALPLLQSDRVRMTLLADVAADPLTLVPAVRRTIRAVDPAMAVTDVQTLGQYFSATAFPFRLLGFVLGACGLMALLLATIGIYGTIAYSVVQRRREMGIRMALGAIRTDILRLVVGQGMLLVGIGLLIGLLLGASLTRLLTSLPIETTLLFGVGATDLLTFAGVTVVLALVAVTACYLPALRATKVDPVVTLRSS